MITEDRSKDTTMWSWIHMHWLDSVCSFS